MLTIIVPLSQQPSGGNMPRIPGVYMTLTHPYHTPLGFWLSFASTVITLFCVVIISTSHSNRVIWRVGLLAGAGVIVSIWLWYLYLFV